ncbi:hypothetical protein [Dyadobacter sediminis]|uniref:hypothetical protein n=1 Tax=Dyadobacter sediminis TaxID=1493691 RepID=UPI0019CA5A66|nr:hypothetical protein [Dyadobacter sediminis]GGB98435.1 hypothetical protein GCM10011325_27150 [Dyadobacter sediminis]
MSKVQYNIGTFKGLLGTAILYLAKTNSGTEFITHKVLEGSDEFWAYISRTALQGYMLSNDIVISSNIDVSKLADTAPDGVLDANGHVAIDNGNSLPRLTAGEAYYSLKGDGIADYTDDPGTPTSGNSNSSGTVVIANKSKTISETLSEAVTWVTKNPLILIVILFALSELLGLTNLLGLRKKKPAKKRR